MCMAICGHHHHHPEQRTGFEEPEVRPGTVMCSEEFRAKEKEREQEDALREREDT